MPFRLRTLSAPSSPDARESRPSTQLNRVLAGRYEILHEIGRGGMATVYLARDIGLTHHLAVIAVDENYFDYYYGTSDGFHCQRLCPSHPASSICCVL